MTLTYIYDHMIYDLIVDEVLKYTGTIDYISSHFTDGITCQLSISDKQPNELQEFITNYKLAKLNNESLSMEQFYNGLSKKSTAL